MQATVYAAGAGLKTVRLGGFGFQCSSKDRNKTYLYRNVARHVGHIRYVAFNATTIYLFFAQVQIVYVSKTISESVQVCNLDETGFTSGRDLFGFNNHLVFTDSNTSAVIPRTNFMYSHRVSVLVAASENGNIILLGTVFRWDRDPRL